MNQDQIKANLLSTTFWIRAVFMLIFALVLWALWLGIIVIIVVQTIIVMITSEVNRELQKLGGIAANYLSQVVSFMVFATEEKPFPFSAFPDQSSPTAADSEPKTGTVMSAAPNSGSKPDLPSLSETADDDGNDDSFYDPERDSGATR